MGTLVLGRMESEARSRRPRLASWMEIGTAAGVALAQAGCAAAPAKRPGEPTITVGASWPESVTHDVERAERACGTRERALLREQQEGKEEQQKFKTLMGSLTGGVGTVGGVLGGVGAYVIDAPDTMKTLTGVTGFVSAGLGAVGSVVTAVVSPGTEKLEASSKALAAIDAKREAARAVLEKKDPSAWSDAERDAWSKALRELDDVCK